MSYPVRLETILNAVQEKKAENITILNLATVTESVTRFFVICEANNTPQLRAVADAIEEAMQEHFSEKKYGRENGDAKGWILVDYVDIVVHIFHPEARQFYNMEDLWNDAIRTDIKSE